MTEYLSLGMAGVSYVAVLLPQGFLTTALTGYDVLRIGLVAATLVCTAVWSWLRLLDRRDEDRATRAAIEAAEARAAARFEDYRAGIDALARQIGETAAEQIRAAGEVIEQAHRHRTEQIDRDSETRERVAALARTVAELEHRA